MAYRRADHERWQQMDFVLGIKIELSNQHPVTDICDFVQGDYPKDFVFDGWHPQCFCYATPILISEDEMAKVSEAFARGETYIPKGKPVTDTPKGFKKWVKDHKEQIQGAKNPPYWVRNNPVYVDVNNNKSSNGTNEYRIEGAFSIIQLRNDPKAIKEMDMYKPIYTNSQKENAKITAKKLNVDYVGEMAFSKADNGTVNPKYNWIKSLLSMHDDYARNCTFTADVLELRMRGINVMASKFDPKNIIHRELAVDVNLGIGWIDPLTNETAKTKKLSRSTLKGLMKELDMETSNVGHYKIAYYTLGKMGHSCSAIRHPNGNLIFYDGQNNELDFNSWKKKIVCKKGLFVLRLDDKIPNSDIIKNYTEGI